MRATGDRGRRPSPYPRSANAQVTPRKSNNRRRYIGGLSALAIAAAVTTGFMSTGSAIAEDAGADTITFNGDCGALGTGLLHKSEPDKTQLYLVEGDEVTFVNNLGTDAKLHVGQSEYDVPDGGEKTLEVSNSVEALMSPDCAMKMSERGKTATLNVSPAAPTDPGTGSGDSNGGQSGDSGSGKGSGGDTGSGKGGLDDGGDVGVPHEGTNPSADDPAAKDKVPDPKDDASSDKSDAAAPADGNTPDTQTSQAGQVEAVNTGDSTQGASGMLALLATVCLVGVGVATVRTMVANRAAAHA